MTMTRYNMPDNVADAGENDGEQATERKDALRLSQSADHQIVLVPGTRQQQDESDEDLIPELARKISSALCLEDEAVGDPYNTTETGRFRLWERVKNNR